MGGAVSMTSVGLFYQILDKNEPNVTVVRYLNNFHVCMRSRFDERLKEIIADTKDILIANLVAGELNRIDCAAQVYGDESPIHPKEAFALSKASARTVHLQRSICKSHRRIEAGAKRRRRS